MSKAYSSREIGTALSEILGIQYLLDATLHFPLEGMVTANVTFYVNEVQANAVVKLCKDGKWRSEHFDQPDVDTTTMDRKSDYRTFKPGPEHHG